MAKGHQGAAAVLTDTITIFLIGHFHQMRVSLALSLMLH